MDFLLLHGGLHGGWCWQETARTLRAFGHRVVTPTLTGSGERAHLLTPEIDLDTGIADIVAVIEAEELSDLTLVAHSLGGAVACGVADRLGCGIVTRLLFLDAMILQNGRSVLDEMPQEVAATRREMARASGMNSIEPIAPESFGLTDADQIAWVARRQTRQAFGCFSQPLKLAHPVGNGAACTYIRCTRPRYPAVEPSAAWARDQPGWSFVEFDACHDAMVEKPHRLACLVETLAVRA
ncbi:alpha/beta hydrolase [Salinisphaera sp. T31B1]|uniref:alpha/beta fold hydrolase n=1 Tax=Salinisphaera sp. T31B1 TaxID=727963 RepID=UPI00333EB025